MSKNLSAPRWLIPFVLLGGVVVAAPLIALTVSIPWAQVPQLLSTDAARSAFALSLSTAAVSTLMCLLFGTPMALWLRHCMRAAHDGAHVRWAIAIAQAVIYAPLVLSPVVSGLALTFVWGRRGFIGGWLDTLGIHLAYSPWGVVVVQVFVSLPFFVATAATVLFSIPRELEEAAATEGAGRFAVMRHIVLPMSAPGLVTAAVVSFARAVSEFGATLTFAGNVEGRSRTIPLLISLGLNSGEMDRALGACVLLFGVYGLALGLLLALRCVIKVGKTL